MSLYQIIVVVELPVIIYTVHILCIRWHHKTCAFTKGTNRAKAARNWKALCDSFSLACSSSVFPLCWWSDDALTQLLPVSRCRMRVSTSFKTPVYTTEREQERQEMSLAELITGNLSANTCAFNKVRLGGYSLWTGTGVCMYVCNKLDSEYSWDNYSERTQETMSLEKWVKTCTQWYLPLFKMIFWFWQFGSLRTSSITHSLQVEIEDWGQE